MSHWYVSASIPRIQTDVGLSLDVPLCLSQGFLKWFISVQVKEKILISFCFMKWVSVTVLVCLIPLRGQRSEVDPSGHGLGCQRMTSLSGALPCYFVLCCFQTKGSSGKDTRSTQTI